MQRTRDNGSQSPVYGTLQGIDPNGNIYFTRSMVISQATGYMKDVVTPGFKARIANGEIINNPMVKTRSARNCGGGSYIATTNGNSYRWVGDGSVTLNAITEAGAPVLPADFDWQAIVEARDRAMARAINNIDRSNINLVEDMLELRKTVTSLLDIQHTMHTLIKNYERALKAFMRKNRVKGTRGIMDANAQVWLTTRFGFAQPIYTAMSLQNAWLQRNRDVQTRFRRASAFETVSYQKNGTAVVDKGGGYTYTYSYSIENVSTFKAYIIYEDKHPFDDTLSGMLGLRLKDVPKGLWQIMPQSWVVDRFFDVSSFIGGAMKLLDPQIKILAAGVVGTQEFEKNLQVVGQTYPGFNITITGDNVVDTVSTKQRDLWSPNVLDLIPHFKVNLGPNPIQSSLDVASVAWRVLSGRYNPNKASVF